MEKQQRVSGRTRVTPRPGRRAQESTKRVEAHLAEAQRVAHYFVTARWPELATVTPVTTSQYGHTPSPELLARLGLSAADLARHQAEGEYTFTFCGEQRADDTTTPMVANVTVDAHLRIIKTSVSR
jgi:uncharacterized phage protein gp47/JayE